MAKRPKRFYEGGMDEKEPGWESKETPAASPKSNIVTKEQLDESGLSLRDYMNKQQGLTRRGESAPAPAPKAEPTSEPSSIRKLSREEGESIRKASEASKAAPAKTESTATPVSAKKETYKDFSGNVQTKKSTTDRDAESAARRAKVVETAKSVGSGIGSLFDKAIENYKSTVPRYNKEKKMAKGGTASSRADGIAQRGKTRGTMAAMCGGGMAKGKR